MRLTRHLLTSLGMELKEAVAKLEAFAPRSLAESWDNVGLLLEPTGDKQVSSVFLTNDLTEEVLDEAAQHSADLIVSYHPPIFAPLKRVTQAAWKERLVARCLEGRVALYSPHTAWDCVAGGINSWLVRPYGPGTAEPAAATSSRSFPGGVSHTVTLTNVTVTTDQIKPLLGLPNVSVSLDPGSLTIGCSASTVTQVLECLPAELSDSVRITSHELPPLPHTGPGRILTLEAPIGLDKALSLTKDHLKMPKLRLALAKGASLDTKVSRIGVCAGSGGKVLAGVKADLLVTGEMSHHEVLDFVQNGKSVILADHSNTERGFLEFIKPKLEEIFENKVKVVVSQKDKDPLEIV